MVGVVGLILMIASSKIATNFYASQINIELLSFNR